MSQPKPEFDPEALLRETERALGFAVPLDTSIEEVHTWLQAKRQDLERERDGRYRSEGFVAPGDIVLFTAAAKGLKASAAAPMWKIMEMLRRKKRRGHRQQEALDRWDQCKHLAFPTDEDIERLESAD